MPLPGSLLCVANFPSNTGYAWSFIEALYAGIADSLAREGISTRVAYPALPTAPVALRGSAAHAVTLDFRLESPSRLWAALRFLRDHRVRALYLTDRPAWHPVYLLLRLAGVRWIVVHDHTSGARTRPTGIRLWLKRLTRRLPGMMADEVIGISDYVARRKVEVDLVPPERVRRVWNSVRVPPPDHGARRRVRAELGLSPDRRLVVCACRAAPQKGVHHLFRAFDRVPATGSDGAPAPLLLYLGDGPAMPALVDLKAELHSGERIILGGYRPDAADLIAGADLCVVPSVWEEGFGLAVLEPMARGIPVVASRVGGIPEVLGEAEGGILVPAADEGALAEAMLRLLRDERLRRGLGASGRRRALAHFTFQREMDELVPLFSPLIFADARRGPRRAGPRLVLRTGARMIPVRRFLFGLYELCRRAILPGLCSSQNRYEEELHRRVTESTTWLDAGCGHRILPAWRDASEGVLASQPRALFGLDPDLSSLRRHRSIRARVAGTLDELPFRDASFDLVTANMVVEHLEEPALQFREIHRVLRPGGVFLFHTPNARGHASRLARLVPDGAKRLLIRVLENRSGADVFPTYYRANTAPQVRSLAREAGFAVAEIRPTLTTAQFALIPPLAVLELLWLRLLSGERLRELRPNLIVALRKAG